MGQYSPKHYDVLNILLCLILAYISSKKVTALSPDKFVPNTVLILQMFQNLYASLYSTFEWYQSSTIQFILYSSYIIYWSFQYGYQNLPTDVFVHFGFCFCLCVCLVRKKEINDRKNFWLWKRLEKYKEKMHKTLQLLQEGVLIIEQNTNSKLLVYHNQALIKIFKSSALFGEYHSQEMMASDVDKKQSISFLGKNNNSQNKKYLFLDDLASNCRVTEEFSANQNKKISQSFISFIEKIRLKISKQNQNQEDNQLKFFIKLQPLNISIELNVVSLQKDSQILLLFKEIGAFKKLQKSKTREQFTNVFINSTAHNIFTPINGIIGVQQLLLRTVTNNPEATAYCDLLNNCLQNLIYNTKNIIELSKIRLNKLTQKHEKVCLQQVIDEIIQIFDQEIKMKSLQINKLFSNTILSNNIIVDLEKLQILLFNILSNAFKYTQQGFIMFSAKILTYSDLQQKTVNSLMDSNDDQNLHATLGSGIQNMGGTGGAGGSSHNIIQAISLQQSERSERSSQQIDDYKTGCLQELLSQGNQDMKYLSFSVIDTGVGIDQQSTKEMFCLFGKIKLSDEQISQKGMGLGLTVSNLICNELGGKMFLDWTMKGKGSKFQVYLPVQLQNIQTVIKNTKINFSPILRQEVEEEKYSCFNQSQESIEDIFGLEHDDTLNFSLEETKPLPLKSEYTNMISIPTAYRNSNAFLPPSQQNFETKYSRFKIDANLQNRELIQSEKIQANAINNFVYESNLQVQSKEHKFHHKILIVDDCAFNIEILSLMLKQIFNLEVDSVMCGKEAIKKVKSRIMLQQQQELLSITQNRQEQNSRVHSPYLERNYQQNKYLKIKSSNNQDLIENQRLNDNNNSGNSTLIENYKLIIMDINMPVMDGVETTKAIQVILDQNQLTCQIVAHTAMPQEQFRTNAERWFDGYLQKPLKIQSLKFILEQAGLLDL
eukprot:403351370